MSYCSKKTVLVTGGAGYIGSVTAAILMQAGYDVLIIDRLDHHQTMHPFKTYFIQGDCGDKNLLDTIFTQYPIHAVVHCAGYIEVGESVIDPARFYANNVSATRVLLNAMRDHNINNIVFSSSCAVYGNPVHVPMHERHPRDPVSPYGRTKLVVEFMLHDYHAAYGINFVGLRYFNAAGAVPEMNLGEMHDPETHVIPLLLRAIKAGKSFNVFGNIYDTHDGTCIRDYVHVFDIARAHKQALEYLDRGQPSDFFNLGTGTGYSVLELIAMAEKVCQKNVNVMYGSRREGDAAVLVADPSKTERVLRWRAEHSGLETIVRSAWAFSCHPRPLGTRDPVQQTKKEKEAT